MNARLVILSLATASIAFVGCKSKPTTQPVRLGESASAQTASPETAQFAPPAHKELDTPTALRHKISNYAQEMEPLLQKKGSGAGVQGSENTTTAAIPAQSTQQISAPKSAPPKSEPRTPNPPTRVNASAIDPRTNQHVEIIKGGVRAAGLNDMPAIVPEGEEGVANTSSRAIAAPSGDPIDERIARRIKDNPMDVSAQLDFQIAKFLNDESVPQLATLAPLNVEDREVITAVMDGLSNFRTSVRAESNMLLSRKVRPLLEMADRLRSQAELSIPTITLCKRVDGFGVYEPIEPARFAAGREQPVIVYCEVENFSSQLNEQKKWETRLQQEAVLFTETGLPVWQDKPRNIVDQSRNRRHDFFVIKMMKLPSNLSIGRYMLKVSVIDQTVKRVAEATLPVQIVAE